MADETGGDVILTAGLDTRPVLAQVQKLKEQLQKEFGSVRVGIQAAMGGATGAAGTRSAAGGVAASSAARSRAVNNVGALPDMTAQQRATQAYYDKLLGVTQAIKGEAEASARTIRIELANEKARQDAIRRSISLIETRQRLEARSSRIIPTDVRQAAGTLQYKFGLQGGAERDEARAAQLRGRQEEEGARRVWQMERDAEQARLKDAQLRWRQEEEGANRVWQMERDADQQRVKDAQLRWRQEDEGARRVWQMQKDADADAIRQAQARTRLIENSQRLQAQFQQQQLQAQRVQITGGGAADNRLTNLQMRAERAIPSPSAGQALMGAPSQAEQIARIMGPATAAVDNYKKALAETGAASLQTARAQVAMRQAFTVASAEIAKEGGLLRQLGAMRGMLGEMGRTIGGLGGTWQRFIINTQVAVQALLAFGGARQVFDIIASQQKLQAILTAVSTSAADQSSSMTQLRRVANEAGFSITELGNAYGQFLIAATKGGETLFTAQNQFEEIAKAARNLSLSTSDMDGVMRALQQMFSKGTVQSEELKLQLGDRIPVAMQAMAKAVQDVTGQATVNLDQMMKKGELVTSKFMGPFIHELFLMTGGADTFEKGSNSMMAGLGRLSNAFMDAAMAMNEGGFGAAVAQVSDKLAALLRSQETANLFSSIGAAIKFAADNAQYLLMILGGIIGIKIGVWAIEVAKTFGILYASLLPIIGALGVLMAALQAVDKLSRASTGQSMADKFRESQKALGLFSTDTIDAMAKGLDALTDPAKAANDALTAVGKGMGVVRDQAKSANEASNGLDAVMGRLGDVMSGIGDGSFDMANLGKIPADQLTEIYRDLQDKIGNANIQLKLGIDDRALRENLEREVGIAQDYLNKIGTNLSRRPPPPTINAPKVDKTEENRQKRVAEMMRQQTLELQQQRDLNTAMAGGMAGTDFGDTLTSLAKINDDYKVRLELEKKDNDLGKDPAKRARLEHMIRERIELDRANKVMQDQLAIREQIDIAQVQGSVAGQNANQQELAVAAEQERLDLLKLGLRPMDEQYQKSMALRREQVLTTQAAKDYNDLLNERRQLMDDIGKAGFQVGQIGKGSADQARLNAEYDKTTELQNKGLDMTDSYVQGQIKLAGSLAQASDAQSKLTDAFSTGTTPLEKARQDLADLTESVDKFGSTMDDVARERVDRAMGDMQRRTEGFVGGFTQGFVDMGRAANDNFDLGKQVFTDAIGGMTDTLTEFVKTGKLNFRELALSMIDYIIKVMIQMAVLKAVMAAMNFLMPGTPPGGQALVPGMGGRAGVGYSSTGGTGMGGLDQVYRAGGVVEPLRAFAQGDIIRRPTHFATTQGPGLMGESGPEVIAPLARTPSGDMGIRVVGGGEDGGGRGGNNVQLNTGDINVSIQGGSNGNSGDDARLAKRVGAEVKGNLQQLVQEEIAKAMAPGGQMRKRY